MAEESGQSRTEQATPRRREEARAKGQVAYSADLSTSFTLVLAFSLLWLISPMLGGQLARVMRTELLQAAPGDWHSTQIRVFFGYLIVHGGLAAGGLIAVALSASLLAGISQAGMRISFQAMEINWERLNPVSGWSRIFSLRSGMRGVMATGKAAVAIVACWWVISRDAELWAVQTTLGGAVTVAWYAGLKIALIISGIMLALAGLDYLFQRQRHEADLRMTRQEVIEERRSEEVDPHLRARMRRLQREAALNRSLADVPRATVVVSNPTHYAVALRYERGESEAPIVLAKGADALARRIMSAAEEHGIPVLRRPPVARALYALGEIGEPIPDTLFHAVAEILAFVYAQRRGQRKQ